MMSLFSLFAASSDGPPVHLTQEVLFELGPIGITNSMLYGWMCIVFITIVLVIVAQKMTIKPKGGFIQLIEVFAEFIRGTVEGAFNNKKKAKKYLPYFLTMFLLILFVNWLGLMPFTRDAIVLGENTQVLRAVTASFNATLAIAAITMVFVYVSSVRELGLGGFFGHFFAGSIKNPLYLIIGILEMFSDLVRVLSLSLRLFLAVAVGELLIAVFAYLGGFFAPVTALPFFLMEVAVLALQAYIFVVLSTMYLAIAVNHGEHSHDEEDSLTEGEIAGKMQAEPAVR